MKDKKRQVTKVKVKDGRIVIGYEVDRDGDSPDRVLLECGDEPAPEFVDAMDDLARVASDILELPGLSVELKPIGLTVKHNPDLGEGVVITAKRELQKCSAPMVINTPLKWVDDMEYPLQDHQYEIIKRVMVCALEYVDGARAQTDLFRVNNDLAEGDLVDVPAGKAGMNMEVAEA